MKHGLKTDNSPIISSALLDVTQQSHATADPVVGVDILSRAQDDLSNVGQVSTPRLLVDRALVHAGIFCAASAIDSCNMNHRHLLKQNLSAKRKGLD